MDQREDRLKATGSWNDYDLESRLKDLKLLRSLNGETLMSGYKSKQEKVTTDMMQSKPFGPPENARYSLSTFMSAGWYSLEELEAIVKRVRNKREQMLCQPKM